MVDNNHEQLTRRRWLAALNAAALVVGATSPLSSSAAPPIAVIAEELGYFPVTDRNGNTRYVPRRIRRESSSQAIDLAERLSNDGVVLAGTYWCPHTLRQKELLGRQAFAKIRYVECSPKGYGADPRWCMDHQIDGYPTWILRNGQQLGGERPLEELATTIGYRGFAPGREKDVPPMIGSSACRLPKK